MSELREQLAEALAAHRYRDVLGDYEVAPYFKHFGCTCGWEQDIAGMNGWLSWVVAHDAHVADVLLSVVEQEVAAAEQRVTRPSGPQEFIGFRGCTDRNPDICACATDVDVECAACGEVIEDGAQVYALQQPGSPWWPLDDVEQEWETLTWHVGCDARDGTT